MKRKITTTHNGFDVYYEDELSHAATHLQETPQLSQYIAEALQRNDYTEDDVKFEADLGRTLGKSDLVETSATDEIIYAKRKNRDGYSRFVKNKTAQPCSVITIHMQRRNDGYELLSA